MGGRRFLFCVERAHQQARAVVGSGLVAATTPDGCILGPGQRSENPARFGRQEIVTMDDVIRGSLKELLGLAREPVALRWYTRLPKDLPRAETKARFCAKLADAARGQCFYTTADEEDCMGGAKYCGLRDGKEFAPGRLSGEFLVARGIYQSVPAVQRAWQGNLRIEIGIFKALAFAPL
jgi:uncharacterized protein (DUF169 family)